MDDQTNFIRGLFERVSAAGVERTKDFHSAIPQFEFIVYSQKCCFCISAKNLLANHRLSFLAELRRLKRRRNSGLGHQWKQEKHKVINPCFKCSKSEQKNLVEGNLLTEFSSGVHSTDALVDIPLWFP